MLLNPNDPFFAPRWRRIAVLVVCFGWAILELFVGTPTWAAISAGIGLWAGWQLFFKRDADKGEGEAKDEQN